MELVKQAILDTTAAIEANHDINWSQMLDLIHLTNMESSLKSQYQNAGNISARIRLHKMYSKNTCGWFSFIYENCHIKAGMKILEIGCGDGSLWTENLSELPSDTSIVLSDISEGMIRDVQRTLDYNKRFIFSSFDCTHIPYENESFDLVIANHVLFYCEDIDSVCREVMRVLKHNGKFLCSTYGSKHMQEITSLVQEFNSHIQLSPVKLYERFGLENGSTILSQFFSDIQLKLYDDSLLITDAEPLIEYIMSCHGNQNQYLLKHYQDFRNFVKKKTRHGFFITKDAGLFICRK